MPQADFNYEDFNHSAQAELDKALLVKFYVKPVPDKTKTAEAGRPVFKEVEYIDIRIVGKKSGSVARVARESDKARFPVHYKMFKDRIEEPVTGTPLSEWPQMGRGTVETLSFMNVKTVEQLAVLSDNYCSQIMGGNGFKAKAIAYLAYADETQAAIEKTELAAENERLTKSVEFLTEKLAALVEKVEGMDGGKAEAEVKAKTIASAISDGETDLSEAEQKEVARKAKNREQQRISREKKKLAKEQAEQKG